MPKNFRIWDQGFVCFTSFSHWIGSLDCGDRMWHFCVCFGRSPAINAGFWDAALRADLTQELLYWLKRLRHSVLWRWELWNIRPSLDPGLCDCLPVLEGSQRCQSARSSPSDGSGARSPIVLPSRRKPGSLDQECHSMWGRQPCLVGSSVTPLGGKTPTLPAVWRGPCLHCLAGSPRRPCPVTCGGAAKPSSLSRRAGIQGWVYEVRAISRFTVWVVSTGNGSVCTVTVHFIWTQLLH